LICEVPQQRGSFFENAAQLQGARAVFRQLPQQPMQNLEIVVQRAELGVANRDCRFCEHAVVTPIAEQIVRARLDPEIDRAAGFGRSMNWHDALSWLAELAREA